MRSFSVDLYRQLAADGTGDIAFSPASISAAFSLVWAGAGGKTAEELQRVLHFEGTPTAVMAAHGAILGRSALGCELASGNSAWVQQGSALKPAYDTALRAAGNAEVIPADFIGQAAKEVDRINAWVGQRTHERIRQLLSEGALSSDTRLVLANAVYFKGTWKDVFEKKATRDEPFHLLDESTKAVPMMYRSGRYPYYEDELVQVLEMPYQCEDISMVVLLPGGQARARGFRRRLDPDAKAVAPSAQALRRVEEALTAQQLQIWLEGLSTQKVAVSFPRFELNETLRLGAAMQKLGAQAAFTSEADLRGMMEKEGLQISDAFHKTWIKVDEEGTEAAAVTGMGIKTTSIEEPPSFIADRPFLFLLRDRKSGAILFMGRLADPS
jgi:serpin B